MNFLIFWLGVILLLATGAYFYGYALYPDVALAATMTGTDLEVAITLIFGLVCGVIAILVGGSE